MNENSPFVFAGFNHDAAVAFAYRNTDEEIENMLNTMDEQQLLSFYTHVQVLEDRRSRRITTVIRSKMTPVRRALSMATFGALDSTDGVEKYVERILELQRMQNLMQKRVNTLLAPAIALSGATLPLRK